MAKKVVPNSRPVIDKLSIKLTETYILASVKDVSTYSQTCINPLTPSSDQQQFSPNNVHTLSRDKVVRI